MTGPAHGRDRTVSARARDRAEPPSPGPIRPFEFPALSTTRFANGIALHTISKSPFPLVTAMVVLKVGETASPANQSGLAFLTSAALEGGTTQRSGKELAQALEELGTTFGAAAGWDSTTAAVSCLAEHLPLAMTLLAEMVRSPAFDPAEFARYKAQRLAGVRQRRMDPATQARDAHARFMYRDGDVYARPLVGTEESLEGLSDAHARSFVGSRYGPTVAEVVVVGDVEPSEAEAAAEQAFGSWEAESAPVVDPKVAPRQRERVVHVVHRPGAVQSEIRTGHPGVSRSVSDYLALQIMNLTLGGSFSSRLNLNLRERHGFTYGVRSGFAARRGPGPFYVATAVETDVTGAAAGEILREIESMAADGPTEEEVHSAAGYLAGIFPLRMETTGQLASRIAEMIVHDLPEDYYRSYRDRVRRVALADAVGAARCHIRPGELCTVVVGDAEAVAPQLEGLGAGEVVVHEEDEPRALAGPGPRP